MKFNPIIYTNSDSLQYMEVGNWAQKKYKIVGKYCDIFTSGMKNKWNLVFLDLFSGPGFVLNKSSSQLMYNSALISMALPNPFDYYIFNDENQHYANALEARINKFFPQRSYKVFNENANEKLQLMIESIPFFNNGKGTLIFAFLDPFSLNLNFNTVRELSHYQADILVLHALQMDARRNHKLYKDRDNSKVELFTGNSEWRERLQQEHQSPTGFMKFVTEEFDRSIKAIGYKCAPVKEKISNNIGNGIYYLCFYSKHNRGLDFFEKIRKSGNDQYELF